MFKVNNKDISIDINFNPNLMSFPGLPCAQEEGNGYGVVETVISDLFL